MIKPFEELTQDELHDLYFKFVAYRDNECDGAVEMGVQAFYLKRHPIQTSGEQS